MLRGRGNYFTSAFLVYERTIMDNCGIYVIYFEDSPNEFYVGRSSNLHVRLQNHRSALLANRHINSKLQNYYNKYGEPKFEILIRAEPEALKDLEQFYIQEFDSYNNGLNLTNGGENAGYGEGVHTAKHTEQEYISVLEYLANTDFSTSKISDITGVSRDIIKHISSGYAHGYLANKCPDLYKKVMSKKYTRDNSAKSKGIIYPEVISPHGEILSVDNIHKFCALHNLQPQNMHKVLTKQRKSHKGWKLA